MARYHLPQTPAKQKSRLNMLHRRRTIGTDIDMEEDDISPTLKTKKGRASLGSGCLTLDPRKIIASPLMAKRRQSRKMELNSDSDEATPFASNGSSSNDDNQSSMRSNEPSSSLDDFSEPMPFLYRVSQMEGDTKDKHASAPTTSVFGVDFDSPTVSPAKHGNIAERFVIIADSPPK